MSHPSWIIDLRSTTRPNICIASTPPLVSIAKKMHYSADSDSPGIDPTRNRQMCWQTRSDAFNVFKKFLICLVWSRSLRIKQHTDCIEKSVRKGLKQSQSASSLEASLGLDDLRHFVEEGFANARLVVSQFRRRPHFSLYLIGAWPSWNLPSPMKTR